LKYRLRNSKVTLVLVQCWLTCHCKTHLNQLCLVVIWSPFLVSRLLLNIMTRWEFVFVRHLSFGLENCCCN